MPLKAVFLFNDYRSYLHEFYLDRKASNPKYSYKTFATKAGLQSPNYLKLVIDGKRNLTTSNILLFSKALGLNHMEQEYFETLVHFNQAGIREEQNFYKRRLNRIKEEIPKKQWKFAKERDLLSHFLFPAILISAIGLKAEEAVAQVMQKLGLSASLVQSAIGAFVKNGILVEIAGQYEQNSAHVVFHDPAPNRAQKQFLKSQLDFSQLAFQFLYDSEAAKFCAHTFTVEKHRFQECMDEVIGFMGALTQKYDGPLATSQIVQLNFQLFPLDRRLITKC